MDEKRTWRDAKMPQWVKDSIADEIKQWELTSALNWPSEPKPQPMPFRWVEYDRIIGTPIPGHYWNPTWGARRVFLEEVYIRKNEGQRGERWKEWAFSSDGKEWRTSVTRGPLFDNERDARLWLLWEACEDFAKALMEIRRGLR